MALSRTGKNGFPENGFNLYCGDSILPSSNLFRPTSQLLTFSRLADSALAARSRTRGRPRALAALLLSLIRGGVARNVWSGRARVLGS